MIIVSFTEFLEKYHYVHLSKSGKWIVVEDIHTEPKKIIQMVENNKLLNYPTRFELKIRKKW